MSLYEDPLDEAIGRDSVEIKPWRQRLVYFQRIAGGYMMVKGLIGWAIIRAMDSFPQINDAFTEQDGQPHRIVRKHVNFGLAIDLERSSGERVLLVPNIKAADQMDFRDFWVAYEELVHRTRDNQLSPDEYIRKKQRREVE